MLFVSIKKQKQDLDLHGGDSGEEKPVGGGAATTGDVFREYGEGVPNG